MFEQNAEFERLLKALYEGKEDLIGRLASDLFITKEGPNHVEINAFQIYAQCKVYTKYIESVGGFAGVIEHGSNKYYFG